MTHPHFEGEAGALRLESVRLAIAVVTAGDEASVLMVLREAVAEHPGEEAQLLYDALSVVAGMVLGIKSGLSRKISEFDEMFEETVRGVALTIERDFS